MRIGADEVHVYIARPQSVDIERARSLVPPDEQVRAASFRFDRNRREHLVTRALLRASLSRYRPEIEPRAWHWKLGEHGKPFADPPCGLFFNVSNHPDMVVCAIARRDGIGVDLEPIARGEEIVDVGGTVFAPTELAGLTPDRAVTLWTVKEAWIKALGLGFSAPVKDMVVDLSGDVPAIDGYFVAVLDIERHRIAIAVRGAPPDVRVVRFEGLP